MSWLAWSQGNKNWLRKRSPQESGFVSSNTKPLSSFPLINPSERRPRHRMELMRFTQIFIFYPWRARDSAPAWVKGNASFFISRFTREGRKIIVAFPFPNRSGPPLSEDLQVRRNGIHAERCEWNTCNEPERGTDFHSRRLSPWTEST